jgi:nucleoside-diphosphate-sugar epimerase
MKILLLGGTGFVGSRLLKRLTALDHEVTVLTRSSEKAAQIRSRNCSVFVGDLLDPDTFISKLEPHDLVISVAMPQIKPRNILLRQYTFLKRNTTLLIRSVIEIAEKLESPLVLTLGTSFRTKGDEVADESWPIERFGITKIGEDVDPILEEIKNRGTPQLIEILPGQIYGPGGLSATMIKMVKKGRYRISGKGDNYFPRVFVDDCVEAYVRVVEKLPVGQRFILADDLPCKMKNFIDYLAECLDVPPPRNMPPIIPRLILGKRLVETMQMNCIVSNRKAKEELGWTLKYPTYKEGLRETIRQFELQK